MDAIRKQEWQLPSFIGRRYVKVLAGTVAFFSILWLFQVFQILPSFEYIHAKAEDRLPPTYEIYHDRERHLPQHSIDLSPPNGKSAKYLYFSNHAHGTGWGNAMQEIITNANLAWETNRAFVFHNYTWDRNGEYSDYKGHLIPSRIPLSALISGPIIGGPFDKEHAHIPLSVSLEFFNSVCPNPVKLHYTDVPESYDGKLEGSEILRLWAAKINSIDDPCVMINPESPSVFDVYFFGDPRARSLYPSLKKSPVLTQFGWSSLVLSAFESNRNLFFSTSRVVADPSKTPSDTYSLIPHLLALHIRRGDFEEHCVMLANWSANWNAFNRLPGMLDTFDRPLDGNAGWTTPANMEMYMRKCLPSIPQIVHRVQEIKKTNAGKPLSDIYIMTNAHREWINELREALNQADPGLWRSIKSGRDLELNWEQKYVAQSVDMYAGQRAGVFIGNGFSSLTSNIVLIRMQRDVPAEHTRFW